MRIGKKDKLVTIKKVSETQEQSGELTTSYLELAKEWASIEPITGREFFSAQQVQSAVTNRISMRFRRDVAAKMIITYRPYSDLPEDVYVIDAVINSLSNNRELLLLCTKITAEGLKSGGSGG